jgi:hypothetical protein
VKKWIVAAALVVIAAIVVWMRPGAGERGAAPSATASGAADRSSPEAHAAPDRSAPARAAPPIRPPIHVTRLGPGERATIEQRIAEARAARAAHASSAPAPAAVPVPDHVDQLSLETAPVDLVDALKESIPILAECYRGDPDARGGTPVVLMTLEGDPDVGTLVDPDQLGDADGKPLDPRIAECLRTTLSSIELPPLRQGQELSIQYTFRFDDD